MDEPFKQPFAVKAQFRDGRAYQTAFRHYGTTSRRAGTGLSTSLSPVWHNDFQEDKQRRGRRGIGTGGRLEREGIGMEEVAGSR